MYTSIKLFFIFWLSFTVAALTKEINGERMPIENGDLAYLIATFLSTIAYAVVMAKYDSTINIKGTHYIQATIRGILLAILPVLIWIYTKDATRLLLIPFAYSVFYFCFDLFYNKYKGEPTFYVGKEALTDRIVRWLNQKTFLVKIYPLWYIVLKASFVLISLWFISRFM